MAVEHQGLHTRRRELVRGARLAGFSTDLATNRNPFRTR
jgi:hypothetical protein